MDSLHIMHQSTKYNYGVTCIYNVYIFLCQSLVDETVVCVVGI